MDEAVAERTLSHFAEIRPRHHDGMNVQPVGVEGKRAIRRLPVVDRDQHEIYVRLRPYGIVGEAAAKDGCQHGPVPLNLPDERIQSRCKLFPNRNTYRSL